VNTVVVDASTVLAWCFPDEASTVSESVLLALRGQSLIVPAIWPLEVANAVLVAERRGRLKLHHIQRFLELLGNLNITEQWQPIDDALRSVLPLAQKHNLTAYDAAYLDLALRQGAPLATFDDRLKKACSSEGIQVFSG